MARHSTQDNVQNNRQFHGPDALGMCVCARQEEVGHFYVKYDKGNGSRVSNTTRKSFYLLSFPSGMALENG